MPAVGFAFNRFFYFQGEAKQVKKYGPDGPFLPFPQLPEAETSQPLCEECPAAVLGQSHQAQSGSSRSSHSRRALALSQDWGVCLTAALGILATETLPHKGPDSVSCSCNQSGERLMECSASRARQNIPGLFNMAKTSICPRL